MIRRTIWWLLPAACAIIAVGLWLWWPAPAHLRFEQVRGDWRSSDGALLDRSGKTLGRRRIELGARRLDWIALSELSPALVETIVHAEDRRFRMHGGIDTLALLGVLRDSLLHGRQRGASTITMQLAVLLDPALRAGDNRWSYKLRQMRAARALERTWSKEQIIEAYFNRLGYRGDLIGIDAAARILFSKAPSGITHDEALLLAALLPSPTAAPAAIVNRACALAGNATCSALSALANQVFATRYAATDEDLAPHLTARLVTTAATKVTTTLDADLQRLARDALDRHISRLSAGNVRDGAVLIAEVSSGAVRAYVAANRTTSRAPEVDGVRALRQAGSTLKPFLYGLALERGYVTAASLLDDSPLNLNTAYGLYLPQNYDRAFRGLVSVRTALASSLNIPAVRTAVLTGVEPFRERLVASGYSAIVQDGEYYGYALALGSAEVSLWQQVAAYRMLARGGLWSDLSFTPDVESTERRVLSPEATAIVTDILGDRAARVPTFGVANVLATPFWSAVKTGTSKDMRDNWCIGFTSRYVIGVWVGNFEGDSMQDVSGVTGAAPIWQELMDALHAGDEQPALPAGVIAREVRFEPAVEPARRELFIAGSETGQSRAAPRGALNATISSPANGMVVAIDPDIPQGRQRIPFSAESGSGHEFILDGKLLGDAQQTILWPPRSGAHRLLLRAADGNVVDQVLFTVR